MGWSDLPSELLLTIAGTLTEFPDQLRFRSVCSHWRSAFKLLPLPPQLPWLLLPFDSLPHFYSLSENRIYPFPLKGTISSLFGSASGRVLTIQGQNRNVIMINPFTGALMTLPSPNEGSSLCYVANDTLVWDRSDWVVVAACSMRNGMFYCRADGGSWEEIEFMRNSMVSSVVFYESRFYVLNDDTREIIVLDGETLEEIRVINPPYLESYVEAYLCVSRQELFLLVKSNWMELFLCSASHFYKVYRMDLNEELEEWREVYDIGDRAVFLDDLHCFMVEVKGRSRLRKNCIYSYLRGETKTYGVSLFDLGSSMGEKLEGELSRFSVGEKHRAISRPTWIVPSLS